MKQIRLGLEIPPINISSMAERALPQELARSAGWQFIFVPVGFMWIEMGIFLSLTAIGAQGGTMAHYLCPLQINSFYVCEYQSGSSY
jgi:hypothetical protein